MEHRTSKPEYIKPILITLNKLGCVSEEQLIDEAFLLIQEKLHPADFMILPNGVPRWKNQMLNMLDGLVESGRIMKKEGTIRLI